MFFIITVLCTSTLTGGFSTHVFLPYELKCFELKEGYKLILFAQNEYTGNITLFNNKTYEIAERVFEVTSNIILLQYTGKNSITVGIWHIPKDICTEIIEYHSGCNFNQIIITKKNRDVCIFLIHPEHLFTSNIEARDYQSSIINLYNEQNYYSPFLSNRRTLKIVEKSPYFIEFKAVKGNHQIEIHIDFMNSGTDYDDCEYGSINLYQHSGVTNNFDENNETNDECSDCKNKPDSGEISEGLKIIIAVAVSFILLCIIIPITICISGLIKKSKNTTVLKNKNKNTHGNDNHVSDNSVISYSNLYSLNIAENYNRYTEPTTQESNDNLIHPSKSPYH